MSDKEKIIRSLNDALDYKMGYVLAYIQGITADEETDDIFCQKLFDDCKKDSGRHRAITRWR